MRKATLLYLALAIALAVAFVGAVAWRDTFTVTVTTAEVPVRGLTREVRILHASDLHGVSFGKGQDGVASVLRGQHFDAAIINGDNIASITDADHGPVLDLLGVLQTHADLVFVTRGNHDTPDVMDALVEAGAVAVEPGDPPVRFATDAGELVAVPAVRPPDVPDDATLVLALGHYPLTDDAVATQSAGRPATTLYLFGHTHGGQVRVPPLGAIWAPGEVGADGVRPRRTAAENFFPELRGRTIAGLERIGDAYAHTSRGVGTQGGRLRLWAPAEITVITLVPAT